MSSDNGSDSAAIQPSDSAQREQQRLGIMLMEFFDHLREEHGDGFRLDIAAICAEVTVDIDDEPVNYTDYFCSETRGWVQTGFFERVKDVADTSASESEAVALEDEDD